MRRCSEAADLAAAGVALWPIDQRWRDLERTARALCRRVSPQPKPAPRLHTQIVVASVFCGEDFIANMKPARENHSRWCTLHGYTYACLEENTAGREDPTWSKILHVLDLFEKGAEYVFWMDADSLFIHDGVDLQWACELDRDFVFSGDLNVVFNA